MRTWQSPYEIIGNGDHEDSPWYQPLDRVILRTTVGSPAWNALDSVSSGLCWCVCRFGKNASSRSQWTEVGHNEEKWASESIVLICLRYAVLMCKVNVNNFFGYMSTSTVDINRWPIFFCMNRHRRSISTVFFVLYHIDRRYWPYSRKWIGIDGWYRPCSPVGELASTVDIDRDISIGQ